MSIAKGEHRDREINATSAELMVLTRARDGWKIRAILVNAAGKTRMTLW